jgi:hypothetical protein
MMQSRWRLRAGVAKHSSGSAAFGVCSWRPLARQLTIAAAGNFFDRFKGGAGGGGGKDDDDAARKAIEVSLKQRREFRAGCYNR